MSSTRLFALILSASAPVAGAATVTYTTASFAGDGSNVSILSNEGTVVNAINFSTSPVRTGPFSATNPDPNVTLNGIAFTSTAWNASVPAYTWNITGAGVDTDRDSNVVWSQAPQLDGLVYDTIRTSGNGVGMVFTLNNLTVGQQYRAQFVFSALDAARRLYLTSQADADQNNGSHILSYGTTNGAGLLRGVFTADATTQTFNFWNTNAGSQRVSLAGYVLTAIPEPAGVALVGFGALGLLRRRRVG